METIVNKVQLTGVVGQDPLITALENGEIVAQFSMATIENHKQPNGDTITETDYHSIEAWGKIAMYIETYVGEGNRITVEGKIKQRPYQSKGDTHCCYQIVISKITLLENAKS